MGKGRLEAFSDGVLAIVLTIMVLELHAPKSEELSGLRPLWPVFLSYVLSFAYIGIYWTNHHHLLQAVREVNGLALWANLHLLFWLSLTPFTTAWMGENDFGEAPAAVYGVVLLMASIAYFLLAQALIRMHGHNEDLARAIGNDRKGRLSSLLYAVAIPLAFMFSWVAVSIYAIVALMWVVPDRRIARTVHVHP